MTWILDAAVVLLMLIITIAGIRKGIVRAAAEFLGAIVSALTASWLGGMASVWIYDTFFRQGLYERILKIADGKTGKEASVSLFSGLPDFVVRLLESNGITQSSVTNSVSKASSKVALDITNILSPVFISIIKIFAVIILFILFMIIIKALASLLSNICRLPVLSQLNGLLGGVFGFCLSVVIIWLIFGVISFAKPVLDKNAAKTIDTLVKDSMVTKTIVSLNPFEELFK